MEVENSHLEISEDALPHLISKIRARNRQTFILSLSISAISLALGGIWLFYSFKTVSNLNIEADNLNANIAIKNAEFTNTNNKLAEATNTLLALNPMLEKYGLLKRVTADDLNTAAVIKSLEANKEIQEISPSGDQRRSALTILYYLKDTDSGKVGEALREFGFNLKVVPPVRADLPSNLVGFGRNVNAPDAKLAVYVLMRAGAEIKEICKSDVTSKASIIQVLGAQGLLSSAPLTVEQVRNQVEFRSCASI